MGGILPSAEELAKMTESDRARIMAQMNAAAGGMVPDAVAAARAAASSGASRRVGELAAVPLSVADALAPPVPGVEKGGLVRLGERVGLLQRAEAPAPAPDAPAEAAEEPPFRMFSEQMPDAAHKAEKGAGGGRAGPFQIGTDQRSGHTLLGRPVPKEAKDAWDTAVKYRGDAVDIAERGVEAEGAARDAFFVRREQEMAAQQQRAEALAKQKQEALKALDDRVQSRLDEERSPGAIANRTVSRVMSGIGMALGAYAATIRGGPNHAFEIYKQHINEEAAALERQSRHEDNLYARMYRSFGDKEQALAATRAALHDRGALELAKIESTTKTAHGKAAAADMRAKNAAELGNQRDHIASVEANKEEVTQAQSRGVFAGGPTDPLHLAPSPAAPPPPDAPARVAPPERGDSNFSLLRPSKAGDDGAERTLLRPSPAAPPPPAARPSVGSAPPKYSAEASGSVSIGAPPLPPPPAGRTAKEQAIAMARWDMIKLGQEHPEELKAAQAQLNKSSEHDKGALKSAIVAAVQADRAFPTGAPAAEVGNILRSAKYRAWDAARSLTTGKPASLEFAAGQAVGKALTPSFPPGTTAKEKQQLMAYWELKARVIRARAGANLGANEEKLYNDALGSDDVEKLRVAMQVIKEDIAARWEERMHGYHKNTVRLLESYGTPTKLNPHERWIH
jgi:hypothetical protein